MATAPPRPRTRYPTSAAIDRMVGAARKAGLDVAGFDALPDGTIRILDARIMPKPAAGDAPEESLFEKLEREGKL